MSKRAVPKELQATSTLKERPKTLADRLASIRELSSSFTVRMV
jgi:hypothetical protein